MRRLTQKHHKQKLKQKHQKQKLAQKHHMQKQTHHRQKLIQAHHKQKCVCVLFGCFTPLQHASESQGHICSGNCSCCNLSIEVADPTGYLIQSLFNNNDNNIYNNVIIMTALKGTIQDCLQCPHCTVNCLQHTMFKWSGCNPVQYIGCSLCATYRVQHGTKKRLSY